VHGDGEEEEEEMLLMPVAISNCKAFLKLSRLLYGQAIAGRGIHVGEAA
jgi:hypothetical protein